MSKRAPSVEMIENENSQSPRVVEVDAPEPHALIDDNSDQSSGEACPDLPLATRVEALLLATDRPLTESRLAELIGVTGKGSSKAIVAALEELNALYNQSSRSFRAERLAGGWQLLTTPAYGAVLHRLHTDRQISRLSQPALESLAIVSYRQPIMRAEIEAIRGVASGEVLRGLLERRLVKIVGRAEVLGRPMLYGTTNEFLKVFGLASLEDLPAVKGLMPEDTPAKRLAKFAEQQKAAEEAETKGGGGSGGGGATTDEHG